MIARVTRKAWFGPKRIGWGLRPTSWQGWLATAVCTAGFAVSLSALHSPFVATGFLVALGVVIAVTTSRRTGPGVGGR